MKSGQGYYPSCVPRPAVGGIAGGRARPEKNRAPGRADGEMKQSGVDPRTVLETAVVQIFRRMGED